VVFSCNDNLLAQSDTDFYESQIRPLFIKHCIKCHGPDKQESDLRLDASDYWEKGGISGPALIPRKPEESLLLNAVKQTDPDLKMPPGKNKLTATEIQAIEQWIKTGAAAPNLTVTQASKRLSLADAQSFWSFQPVTRPNVPDADANQEWAKTPVDQFILRKLNAAGITPSSHADKRTLIRRASFDLTGLPPTPEEIASFVKDASPNAFSVVVNRLLDSKAYGERWGRHWLDVARYADTAGDGADYPVREAVKYRDWVINAFNSDKPYDDFLREQIAGDIIAQSGPDELYAQRVIATGFLAIGKRYGYKPSPDYQHLDFADVIDSLGRATMGLTIGCARCHDHKYDPISAADYYALYGVMQSTTWAFPGGEEQKRPSHFPAIVPPTEVTRLEELRKTQIAEVDRKLAALAQERQEKDASWVAGGVDLGFESQELQKPLTSPWVCSGPIEVRKDSQSPYRHVHPAGTRGVHIGSSVPTDGIRYVFPRPLNTSDGRKIHFTVDFRTQADASQNGAYRIYLGQGVIESTAVDISVSRSEIALKNGGTWEVLRKLVPGTWYTLQIAIDPEDKSYSGTVGTKEDLTSFKDKKAAPTWNGVVDCFICDAFGHIEGAASARDIDNIGLSYTPFAAAGSVEVQPGELSDEDKARLVQIKSEIEKLETRKAEFSQTSAYEVAYGVSEGTPVNAHIQLRGEPDKPGDVVQRRFLEVLGGDAIADNESGSGRLQLAHWLTRPENPLTARVFVNRVWQWHFGSGIVATPSDFGFRGTQPTHPELLDWLTSEFVSNNWSIKQLHRLIMRSRVYQIASDAHPTGIQKDPENKLLWRYNRRPLDAESMRDSMLAVSQQLDTTKPKPHPFPDVNTWGFTIHHPFHAVYGSNHRSVYLMQQRNRRHPYLELFDSADPNVSIAKRQTTVTPTQALYLMNSEFVHAQAHWLAHRVAVNEPTVKGRIRLFFEIAHGRQPSEEDFNAAVDFVTDYQEQLPDADQSTRDQKVWSAFARVMLTSNGFLFID
tara:strand:- start:7640 stop:10663 length:3024 start_codon:yes stop_codon:yes gene_type:complete